MSKTNYFRILPGNDLEKFGYVTASESLKTFNEVLTTDVWRHTLTAKATSILKFEKFEAFFFNFRTYI